MRAAAALFLVLPALFGCTSTPPRTLQQVPQQARPQLDLPYRLVTLENGLTLVMQPDPSMPLVGVEVWTRGGSREEAAGQHGIAHLFEHNLPSSGRFLGNPENRARRAATSRASGAGTEPDFLRFYNNAAPEGLEAMLGSLADRLESDPAKFSDEAVERDHDIVISELRRSMGLDWSPEVLKHLHRGTFGEDHPYGHAVQGSEADVRAANAETMREWHRRFAGAANAIVFLVGNFEPARAEQLVRHHFGSIAPGIRTPRATEWIPQARALREVLEKDVAGETVYLRWPVPGWGSADGEYLTLIAHVLNERLAAQGAVARVELYELAGAFTLRGTSEAPLRAELARVLRDGITDAELARVKLRQQTDFVRMLQRPVWRGSRADVLGFGLLFRGDADHYRRLLGEVASATSAVIADAARRWLGRDGYVLQVVPQGKRTALAAIDRSATIAAASATRVAFPRVESAEANGVRVLKVERNAVPLAQLTFAFDRGTDVDALRASIAEKLANLGAAVGTENDPDFALLHVSVLSDYADEATSIVASGAAAASTAGPWGPEAGPAPQERTPTEQRAIVLECLITDCDTKANTTVTPRVFIASGDVRNLTANIAGSATANAPTALRAPQREHFQIIDYPTAPQSYILLAQVLPPSVAKDPLAAQLVVSYLLRSRLMDNLRSAKGWSYEVYPFAIELRRGGALARFNIPVQTDKTAESIAEVRKEIARLQHEPVTPEELNGVRGWLEAALTGGLLSLESMNAQLLELARNDLPLDYYNDALRRLAAFTPANVQAIARELFTPERLIWIIAGQRAAIEGELRELGAEVHSAP